MHVIVREPGQAQHRRPDVGVVAEELAEPALARHAGPDHAEPGLGDLVLEIAVVPGKAGLFVEAARRVLLRRARRRRCPSRGQEEVVGVGEQDEVRRAVRVGRDHVQQVLLGLIRQRLGHADWSPPLGPSTISNPSELARFPLELAGHGVRLAGIAVDVEGRRVVEMDAERRGVAEFGRKHELRSASISPFLA